MIRKSSHFPCSFLVVCSAVANIIIWSAYVGGPPGYDHFLKTIRYMNAPDHDRFLEWVGGWFDPEWLDLDLIRFGNPQSRWRVAFQEQPMPRTLRKVQYHMMRQRD